MFSYNKALLINDIQLWLDSTQVKDFGFISHGHSDHIARHRKIICSPATADLVAMRLKNPNCLKLGYKQPYAIDQAIISLYPAGHILGSAQIKIKLKGTSLLYTGDFRISPALTAETFEYVDNDILIMESTFGLPQYKFPSRHRVQTELLDLCSDLLKLGKIPAIFAYTLGKGQEALKILGDAGLPVAVDPSILRYIPIYQKYGLSFQSFSKFEKENYKNKVVLLSVNSRFRRDLRTDSKIYRIFLSGWAMQNSRLSNMDFDKVLPLSDHADFSELLQLVETLKPQKIYCTHGFPQFVSFLRNAGYRAYHLENEHRQQLDLFD